MNLGLFAYNQTVTLASDEVFRGYFIGPIDQPDPELGPMVLVAVVAAGCTGRRGNTKFPLSDLRPVKAARR